MKKLNEISDKLMQSYKTGAQARVKKLEADFKGGDRSMARATEIRKRDRNIITVGHKLAKRELAANTKAHTDANAGPKKPVARDSGSASDYYKFKKPGQYVGDSIEVAHDGEQINEVSKRRAAERKAKKDRKSVVEGLPQTLRKVVPGYAKREIDKKMDAGKFGKTDADKDANFQRYKKIQDKIKEQGVAEAKDAREYDYEGDMAKSQLRSIISNAQTIHDMLKDDTNMAEWVQNKITLSADYISTVRDYMSSETNEENTMDKVHPDALHVKPVEVNGKTKYKVHAVGSNFSDGIKKGEHLSDTELDDFSEMGGKVKHMKEQRSLNDILDEARGRPRKNPVAAPAKKSGDDEEEDYGPDTGPEADQHIQNQLKRAHDAQDLKGGADVKFENGQKHFIKSEHAHKVLTALEKLKPADRAEAASHVYKSHENFKAVHAMLK